MEQTDNSSRAEKSLVSESEKHGVAVIGRHLVEKIEHVPIKKRRFLFKSSSPPPRTPSPHHKDSEQHVNGQPTPGQSVRPNSVSKQQGLAISASSAMKSNVADDVVISGKISEVTNGKPSCSTCEDFSGIEMLAAAACNDSMGSGVDIVKENSAAEVAESVKKGVNASPFMAQLQETVASCLENSVTEDFGGSVPANSRDDSTEKKLVLLNDDRSHWDLNTVMDAWEQPYPTAEKVLYAQRNVTDTILGDQLCYENQEVFQGKVSRDYGDKSKVTIQSMVQEGVSSDVHGSIPVIPDSRNSAVDANDLNQDGHKFISVPNQIIGGEKYHPLVLTSENFPVSDAPNTISVFNADAGDNTDSAPSIDRIEQEIEDSPSGMQLGSNIGSETILAEKHDFASTHGSVSVNTAGEKCADFGNKSGLHDGKLSTDKCQSPGHDVLDVENQHCKSAGVGVSCYSPKCVDVASDRDGQPVGTNDATFPHDKSFGAEKFEVNHPLYLGKKEPGEKSCDHPTAALGEGEHTSHEDFKSSCHSPKCSGKVFDSEDFRNSHDHIDGMKNMTEHQEGYDSQFEDGEVRESLVHCWEYSEAEDGEAEQVDYGSDDNRDRFESVDYSAPSEHSKPCLKGSSQETNTVDAELTKKRSLKASNMESKTKTIKENVSKKQEMDIEVDRGLGAASVDVSGKERISVGDALKESGQQPACSKSKISAWDQQPEVCATTTKMAKESSSGNLRRDHLNGYLDGPLVKDGESRRGMLTRNERLPAVHLYHRSHNTRLQPNSDHDDLSARGEKRISGSDRATGRDRPYLQMHDRRCVGSQWDNHSVDLCNSKRHHSPSNNGPYDSGKPRLKSFFENSDPDAEDDVFSDCMRSKAEASEYNWHQRGRPIYSPTKGGYPPFHRRRFTEERDNDYHLYRGQPPVGDISPHRTRGRTGRYHQGVNSREGYFRPLPNDSDESFAQEPSHLVRTERSFSPMLPRGCSRFTRPQERYHSRSRSRSPVMRQFPRERNTGFRQVSRSMDFRPEARMERVRMPIRKPGFGPDYEGGNMSPPPRNRFSPQVNPRWISDRNHSGDGFRNNSRRSPPRVFRQDRRFNLPGSPGQLNPPVDYMRPAARSRKFTDMACAGREHRDDDDEDRRPSNRYEMCNPARRYVMDGVG